MAKVQGLELFTLSKNQFKLYFDTLFRLRAESRIETRLDQKHVYVRAVNKPQTLMSELILNIEPKADDVFEIPLESLMKINPKKDLTFYHDGNTIKIINDDFTLKVSTLDSRCSKLSECPAFPKVPSLASLYLEKDTLEVWYDYFKTVANDKEGIDFIVKDGNLTICGTVENEDKLEMNHVVSAEGSTDCECVIPAEPLVDAFAHWKVYDTVKIRIGNGCPLHLEFGSDLLQIRTIIAPIYRDDE